jgi:VIT1/CCC1 family predicted Fe2+/Mn2+ transporter
LTTSVRVRQVVPPSEPSTPILRRAVLERATVREILMGAQDNLTNVLAVMLGVSIGSGRASMVALACLSAAVAESVSMGGVLYTSTRAEYSLDDRLAPGTADDHPPSSRLSPAMSGATTFAAALVAGLVPLVPFVFFALPTAVPVSMTISIAALFGLGATTGRVSGGAWFRDGIRLIVVAGVAALAAALIGVNLPVD